MAAIDFQTGESRRNNRLALVVTVIAAALLSILYSGWVPYFNNNIYHLPILRADYDLPQFTDDAFIQSLRHFSSGFWLILAGSARLVAPHLLLLTAFILSRVLMLAAAVHLARSLGFRGKAFDLLFLLLLAVSPLTRGYAPGGGGLDIDYFSHSELANAVLVLSLSMAIRGATGLSVFLACVTFFLNAFMAVWLAPLWLAVTACRIIRHGEPLVAAVRRAVFGTLAGLPLVLIVVKTVVSGAAAAAAPDYSYAAYLRAFFPYHFFLDSLAPKDLILIGLFSIALLASAPLMRKEKALHLAAVLAAIGLLAAGAIVPLLTESRFILNLHLIRSAVLIQLLAVLGLSMIAAGMATATERPDNRLIGLLLSAMIVVGSPGLPAALLLVGYASWGVKRLPIPLLDRPGLLLAGRGLLAASLAFSVTSGLLPSLKDSRTLGAISGQWARVGAWVADNTPATSLILLPVGTEIPPPAASPQARLLAFDVTGFMATAGRSVWTNYKFGAAPMWAPSTYAEWHRRYGEVQALATAQARIAYAANNGIDIVITFCDADAGIAPLHRDGDLCIYDARRQGG